MQNEAEESTMRKDLIKEVFRHALRNKQQRFVIGLVVLIVAGLVIDFVTGFAYSTGPKKTYIDQFEPFVNFATLIVACAVWFGETHENWLNVIPKKLTVIFEFDGKPVMICNRADLSGEADIRALAQQIGRQMARGEDLKFKAPLVRQSGGQVANEGGTGYVRDYKVVVTLNQMPKAQFEPPLVWNSPFDDLWKNESTQDT